MGCNETVKLPYILYRTCHALEAIGGRGRAIDVANRSGFNRPNESMRLNTLALIGVVKKELCHREQFFTLIKKVEIDFSQPKRVRQQ